MKSSEFIGSFLSGILAINRRNLLLLILLILLWYLILRNVVVGIETTIVLASLVAVLSHPVVLSAVFWAQRIYRWFDKARAPPERPSSMGMMLDLIAETDKITNWLSRSGGSSVWRDSVWLSHTIVYLLMTSDRTASSFNTSRSAEEDLKHRQAAALALLVRATARYVFQNSVTAHLDAVKSQNRSDFFRDAVAEVDDPRCRDVLAKSLEVTDADGPGFVSTASYLYTISCAVAGGSGTVKATCRAVADSIAWRASYGWLTWRVFSFSLAAVAAKQSISRVAANIMTIVPPIENAEDMHLRYRARDELIRERVNVLSSLRRAT